MRSRLVDAFAVLVLIGFVMLAAFSAREFYRVQRVPAEAAEVVHQHEYEYVVYHTDSNGERQKNTLKANAVDVKGNCIMFFRDFHVNAVLCPGSMEKVVVIDSAEP